MRQIIYTLCLVFLYSCQKKESFTVLSGTIMGTEVKEIELEGINFSQKISLNEGGAFSDTLNLPYDGMYYLLLSEEQSYYVYLEKGLKKEPENFYPLARAPGNRRPASGRAAHWPRPRRQTAPPAPRPRAPASRPAPPRPSPAAPRPPRPAPPPVPAPLPPPHRPRTRRPAPRPPPPPSPAPPPRCAPPRPAR